LVFEQYLVIYGTTGLDTTSFDAISNISQQLNKVSPFPT